MPSGLISAAASRNPPALTQARSRPGTAPGSEIRQTGIATSSPASMARSGTRRVRRSLTVTTPSSATREASSTAAAISLRAPWLRSSPPTDGGATPADRDAGPAGHLDPGGGAGPAALASRRDHQRHHDHAADNHHGGGALAGVPAADQDHGRRQGIPRGLPC